MTKYLKDRNGKFAGSIGDGKDNVPVTLGVPPVALAASDPSGSSVEDAHERAVAARATQTAARVWDYIDLNEYANFTVDPATGTVAPAQGARFIPDITLETGKDGIVLAEQEAALEEFLNQRGWSLWSKGRSNQYGYEGGWLHPSEVLSMKMAAEMARTGGEFTIVYADGLENEPVGWAILRKD